MQFVLNAEELQLLVEILEHWDGDLTTEIAQTENSEMKSKLEKKRQLLQELENSLMAGDLRFSVDEFELLSQVVSRGEMGLMAEMSQVDRKKEARPISRQIALRRIRDKVSEACAMF